MPMLTLRDPDCKIVHPAHTCRRRDGQLLTGTNGVCHINAVIESRQPTRQPREHTVGCRRCHRPTWNPSAVCNTCDATLYPCVIPGCRRGTNSHLCAQHAETMSVVAS